MIPCGIDVFFVTGMTDKTKTKTTSVGVCVSVGEGARVFVVCVCCMKYIYIYIPFQQLYKPEVTCFIVQSNLIPFWEFVERKYQVALSKNLARPKKLGKIARMREEKSNYCYCCRQTRVEGTWLSYDVDLAPWSGG